LLECSKRYKFYFHTWDTSYGVRRTKTLSFESLICDQLPSLHAPKSWRPATMQLFPSWYTPKPCTWKASTEQDHTEASFQSSTEFVWANLASNHYVILSFKNKAAHVFINAAENTDNSLHNKGILHQTPFRSECVHVAPCMY